MNRKVIALFIIFSLLLPVFVVTAETEVTAASGEGAYQLFEVMGIAPPPLGYDDEMTRIDFLVMLMELFGVATDTMSEEALLAYAHLKGIIADPENFDGIRSITYPEAMKMSVVASGYTLEAENAGGYPAGYVWVGRSMDLTRGTSYGGSDYLMFNDALLMLEALGNVNIRVQTGIGYPTAYTVEEGVTAFSAYHQVHRFRGRVNKNEFTSIYDESARTAKGKIEIGEIVYNYSGEYNLGESVEGYAKTDGGEMTVLMLRPYRSSRIVIESRDIFEASRNRIRYEANGKTADARIQDPAMVIYNGKAFPGYTEQDFEMEEGSLLLIDNDGDNVYDAVHIMERNPVFVGKTDVFGMKIYDKNGKEPINLDKSEVVYTIFSGNVEGAIEQVKEQSAMDVYTSKDGQLTEIHLSSFGNVTGVVTEINKSEKKLSIDGEVYPYNSYFEAYYLQGIALSQTITAALDNRGALMALASKKADLDFGLLLGTAQTEGIDGTLQMRIYTNGDGIKIFNLSKNIRVDKTPKSKDEILNIFSGVAVGNERLIRYSVDANNEIREIVTETQNPNPISDAQGEEMLVQYTFEGYASSSFVYRSNGRYGSVFYTNPSDAAIFRITNDDTLSDDERYTMGASTIASGTTHSFSSVRAYNVNDSKSAQAVVYTSAARAALSNQAASGVVVSVVEAVVEDGEVGVKVTLCDKGYFREYYISDESVLSNVTKASPTDEYPILPGDYIRYSANYRGYITQLEKDFEFKTRTVKYTGSLDSGRFYFAGRAKNVNGAYLSLYDAKGGAPSGAITFVSMAANFMVFDAKTIDVTNPVAPREQLITGDDVPGEGDYVLVHTYQTYSPVMVVYRNIE